MQTSETHTSLYDNSIGRRQGGYYGRAGRPVSSRDRPHTVNVYVSLFILQEKLSISTLNFLFIAVHSKPG